jgi:putative membrane protein
MSDKAVFRLVTVISIFVLAVVVLLNRKILPQPATIPGFVQYLPPLNATINGTCAALLLFSLWAIRKKNIQLHKKINLTAFMLSSFFLVSYILAHFFMPDVKFGDADHNGLLEESEKAAVSGVRGTYLIILTTHIVLAAAVLPIILLSFWFGLKNEVVRHRKIVRFTYPLWLYVTITGVVVYLMVKPYYPF